MYETDDDSLIEIDKVKSPFSNKSRKNNVLKPDK